jgi:hypothetical protein
MNCLRLLVLDQMNKMMCGTFVPQFKKVASPNNRNISGVTKDIVNEVIVNKLTRDVKEKKHYYE